MMKTLFSAGPKNNIALFMQNTWLLKKMKGCAYLNNWELDEL